MHKQILKIYIFIRILTSIRVYKNIKVDEIIHKMFREFARRNWSERVHHIFIKHAPFDRRVHC